MVGKHKRHAEVPSEVSCVLFQFYFEDQTRRRRANEADSANSTARSGRGSQRSFTDEMGLELH